MTPETKQILKVQINMFNEIHDGLVRGGWDPDTAEFEQALAHQMAFYRAYANEDLYKGSKS